MHNCGCYEPMELRQASRSYDGKPRALYCADACKKEDPACAASQGWARTQEDSGIASPTGLPRVGRWQEMPRMTRWNTLDGSPYSRPAVTSGGGGSGCHFSPRPQQATTSLSRATPMLVPDKRRAGDTEETEPQESTRLQCASHSSAGPPVDRLRCNEARAPRDPA